VAFKESTLNFASLCRQHSGLKTRSLMPPP